jgi:integrase
MSVYKRGRVYWYEFEFLGERHRGSTHLRNERLAERYEAKLRSDLALGRIGLAELKPSPRLDKYAARFRGFIELHNKEHPRTIDFYKEKLARLLEYKPLAECALNRIDEPLIEQYAQHRGKTVERATINRELATLRRLLHVARDTHKVVQRIAKIAIDLKAEIGREFVLSYNQEKAYLAAADDLLRDFAVLSLDTGLRAGEAVKLAWNDVSIQSAYGARLGWVHVRGKKSKNANRKLSLTPRVCAMLEHRRRFLPDAHFVFPGRAEGRHILVTSIDHKHARARKAARVELEEGTVETLPEDFVVHSLRHTFGTRLGMDPRNDAFTIMKIMGHSSVTVSQKYVHPTPEAMEQAFERLDAMNEILRGDTEAGRKLGVPTPSPHRLKRGG